MHRSFLLSAAGRGADLTDSYNNILLKLHQNPFHIIFGRKQLEPHAICFNCCSLAWWNIICYDKNRHKCQSPLLLSGGSYFLLKRGIFNGATG